MTAARQRETTEAVVAIACGGTGGHFYPGLTIAQALRHRGLRPVLFLGGRHQAAQLQTCAKAGIDALPVRATPRPRARGYPVFAAALSADVIRAAQQLRRIGAHATLGMGSFASAPLGTAAILCRCPLLLHEGNAVPGLANRLLSRFARVLMLSFPLTPPRPTHAPQELTGMPVRPLIRRAAATPADPELRRALAAELHFDAAQPTVLAFGGSQGADVLNRLLPAAARICRKRDDAEFQLIHLTGRADNDALVQAYRDAGIAAHVRQQSDRMHDWYRLADFALCRAGAATLTELALFRKAAILIPFPAAADDHQAANARAAKATGGVIVEAQAQCTPETLAARLSAWVRTPDDVRQRGQRLSAMARPDAAERVADRIEAAVAESR